MSSKAFNALAVEFGKYDIQEKNEYQFLLENQNYILFGDGEKMVVYLNDSQHTIQKKTDISDVKEHLHFNFSVYLLNDDSKDTFEGPIPFISFLRTLEIDK